MRVGILFSVCDEDERHFGRFEAGLTRLGYPFAVNFDHCGRPTKDRFQRHALYCGGFENDDPNSHFNESHRQPALNVLRNGGFDWALSLDVDETLEWDARGKIEEGVRLGYDVVEFPVLDLWGDHLHYRVDGPFGGSHREKLFNLRADEVYYYQATIHAPRVKFRDREARVLKRYPVHVLHWGIMDMEDVRFHTERWDRIYTRAVGGNPYGTYPYLNDPATVPDLRPVPPEVLPPELRPAEGGGACA